MSAAAQTTFARATAGRHDEFEHALVDARITDCAAIAIRSGETASALLSCLAGSRVATRSPTALRHLIDSLGKKLRRQVAAAANDPDVAKFLRRTFNGTDVAGRA